MKHIIVVSLILVVVLCYYSIAAQPIGYFPFTNLRRHHRRNIELLKEINSLEFNAERRASGYSVKEPNQKNSSRANEFLKYDSIIDSLIPILKRQQNKAQVDSRSALGNKQPLTNDDEAQMAPAITARDTMPMQQLHAQNQVQVSQLLPEDVLSLILSRAQSTGEPENITNCKTVVAVGTSGYKIPCRALRSLDQLLSNYDQGDAGFLRMSASFDEMVDRLRNESKIRHIRHANKLHGPPSVGSTATKHV